ncbi:phospholipase C [Occallatibacter riparius]|uniref:phospholipase C n=1 Tax=Occallatibacter riparius TaxID=1002689 RepID=A0A9J7BM06_9BACT|nr:alkaline phosphatase family protein [Occallatibacter riparius]UWZ82237.1 phospholipase [Occallatibacter riparius]
MPKSGLSRRDILKFGAAAGAGSLAGSFLSGCSAANKVAGALSGCAKVTDIDHVVILIQENRSFDHYFGSYKGVKGFNEQSAAFNQPYSGNTSNAPVGVLLPFHLDITKTNAACTHDISHDWVPQHKSWNNGAQDGFVSSRLSINSTDAVMTMGYYTRADLPYYYAAADAFTLCDNFFCPVMGPSDPNRLYSMAASLDPDGTHGGPLLQTLAFDTREPFYGKMTMTTMPEQLKVRGISWKVYQTPDQSIANGAFSDNILSYFKNYQDTSSDLYHNAFTPQFPADFISDAAKGNLPQVSWILGSLIDSDHPPAPATFGENTLSLIVQALMANPAVWAKTVLFATYDENGGFFDHVPPPTAPPGTAGEWVTAPSVPDPSASGGINGPIGLGFRVPTMIISPFSRGGFVSSDVFDHTSILRFLETRFGAEVPNLSAWRRQTVGDMTSAFNFAKPDYSIPKLPSTTAALQNELTECLNNLAGFEPYTLPSPQQMPVQEAGSPQRPSGASC